MLFVHAAEDVLVVVVAREQIGLEIDAQLFVRGEDTDAVLEHRATQFERRFGEVPQVDTDAKSLGELRGKEHLLPKRQPLAPGKQVVPDIEITVGSRVSRHAAAIRISREDLAASELLRSSLAQFTDQNLFHDGHSIPLSPGQSPGITRHTSQHQEERGASRRRPSCPSG